MWPIIEMMGALMLIALMWEEACKWQSLINKVKAIKASATFQEICDMVKAQREASERNAARFFCNGKPTHTK